MIRTGPSKWIWAAVALSALMTVVLVYRGRRHQSRLDDLCRQAGALAARERIDEAERLYRHALQLAPEHLEALIALERIFATSGRFDEADRMTRRIKHVVPQTWQNHLFLAQWRLSFYDHTRAISHLRAALQARPEHETARRLLAESLIVVGNPQEAENVLGPLLQRDPRDAGAHYLLGKAYFDLAQADASRRHLSAAVARGNPASDQIRDALVRLVQLDLDDGNLDSARRWLDHLMRIDRHDPRVRWVQGLLAARHTTDASRPPGDRDPELSAIAPVSPTVRLRFRPVASDVGIDFRHHSPFTDRRLVPETFGAGVAVFDYDGDGSMDLYFVQGGTTTTAGPRPGRGSRLYRNLGNGTYEDVTTSSGAGYRGYGHGVIAGDYDNDGDTDLYLTNYGPNVLLQNVGNGTFRNVTAEVGVGDARLGTGAAFFDADRDGDLDLYVCNYCKLDAAMRPCPGEEGQTVFCPPLMLDPEDDVFYRNNGDGTFSDATRQAGLRRSRTKAGRGFCAVAADVNLDGYPDLYVANDQSPNFLFLGRGDGSFDDRTSISGADANVDGALEGSMGVAAGDLDGDGRPELFVTNYWLQTNTLYHNVGDGFFRDVTARTLGNAGSRHTVGWGTAMVDFDHDGRLDLIVANGHVDNNVTGEPFLQPAQVWRGRAGGMLVEETALLDGYFTDPHAGRALATGDLDNDGRTDVVIGHVNGPPALLFNQTSSAGAWLRLGLTGTRSNRDALGARVIVNAGPRTLHCQHTSGTGYLSSNDPRLLIGLGAVDRVDSLIVEWPGGEQTVLRDLKVGREYTLVEPLGELRQ